MFLVRLIILKENIVMAVEFEFAPVPMPSGRPKKLRYYPRVVNRRTVSTPDIVKEIEMACTLTRTDVVAVLDALNRSLVGWLKDGWRVHIDGIGYFDVSLTAPERISAALALLPFTKTHNGISSCSFLVSL